MATQCHSFISNHLQHENQHVAQAVFSFIKNHCEFLIRDLPIESIRQLKPNHSATIDQLIVWILEKDPRFEASQLVALDFHQTCLNLLHSTDQHACHFAVNYAAVYAKNLEIDALIPLLNHPQTRVHQFALSLLQSRDPKKDIDFEAWGKILETQQGRKLAFNVLIEYPKSHFTSAWLLERLQSGQGASYDFAKKWIEKHQFHFDALTYVALLIEKKNAYDLVLFIFQRLKHIDLSTLNQSIALQALLIEFEQHFYLLEDFMSENHLNVTFWSLPFLKSLVDGSNWEDCDWWQDVQAQYPQITSTIPRTQLAIHAFNMLTDVRYIAPNELGLDWILSLCEQPVSIDLSIADRAGEYLNQSFQPEAFAPCDDNPKQTNLSDSEGADLAQKTFLFTGQLATMTRTQAHEKVTAAQGCIAKGVSKNLNFLVIGDKGSPLYGEGKKGSKQLKAEQLMASGANLQIISEAAFLLMLSGKASVEAADSQDIEAGCLHLWQRLCHTPNDHLRQVLLTYVRDHHPVLRLQSKHVKATTGGELPASFFTFECVNQLLQHKNADLRLLGCQLAHCHLHAWGDAIPALLPLCDHQDPQVARTVLQAFHCDLTPETKGIYLNPEAIRTQDVLYLCEHRSKPLRHLGIYLLKKHPHLQQTQALVSLIESDDHQVRTAASYIA